jgi:hypothetical protein
MAEVIDLLKGGSWVAFAAFGVYLAYKLAIATVITVGVVKTFSKIVLIFSNAKETNHRMYQLVAAAGMRWPLSPEEWNDLESRVRSRE